MAYKTVLDKLSKSATLFDRMSKQPSAPSVRRSRASSAARAEALALGLHAYAGDWPDALAVAKRLRDGDLTAAEHTQLVGEWSWTVAHKVKERGLAIDASDLVQLSQHERRLLQVTDLLARAARLHIETEANGQAPEDPAPIRVIVEDADQGEASAAPEMADDEA